MRAFDIIGFMIIFVSVVIMIIIYAGNGDEKVPYITIEGTIKSLNINENSLDDTGLLMVKSLLNDDRTDVSKMMGLYRNQLRLKFIFTARPAIIEPRRRQMSKIAPTEKDEKYEGTRDGYFIFSSTRYEDSFYLNGLKEGDKVKIIANADDISCITKNNHNICTLEVRAYEVIT